MVSNTQTIRRQQPTNCLIMFDYFVSWRLKGYDNGDNNSKGAPEYADFLYYNVDSKDEN